MCLVLNGEKCKRTVLIEINRAREFGGNGALYSESFVEKIRFSTAILMEYFR